MTYKIEFDNNIIVQIIQDAIIDKIVATLSKVAEVVLWSTAPNYKKDEFMHIVLRLGNHRTLLFEDLKTIRSIDPLSIETYTDGNNVFLEIQVKL